MGQVLTPAEKRRNKTVKNMGSLRRQNEVPVKQEISPSPPTSSIFRLTATQHASLAHQERQIKLLHPQSFVNKPSDGVPVLNKDAILQVMSLMPEVFRNDLPETIFEHQRYQVLSVDSIREFLRLGQPQVSFV